VLGRPLIGTIKPPLLHCSCALRLMLWIHWWCPPATVTLPLQLDVYVCLHSCVQSKASKTSKRHQGQLNASVPVTSAFKVGRYLTKHKGLFPADNMLSFQNQLASYHRLRLIGTNCLPQWLALGGMSPCHWLEGAIDGYIDYLSRLSCSRAYNCQQSQCMISG